MLCAVLLWSVVCRVLWYGGVLCCVSSVVLCAVCYCDVLRYVVLYERSICVHSQSTLKSRLTDRCREREKKDSRKQ